MEASESSFEPCGGESVGTADRRRAIRVAHCAPFRLRPLRGGETVLVVLQDLSATGMGVLHSEAMRPGEQYEVPLERQGGDSPPSLLCTVKRCEMLDEGLFSVGFEFNGSAAAIDAGSRQITGQLSKRD